MQPSKMLPSIKGPKDKAALPLQAAEGHQGRYMLQIEFDTHAMPYCHDAAGC